MLYKEYIRINAIAIHKVGNKVYDEGYKTALSLLDLDDSLMNILSIYFLCPFKSDEYYCFSHDIDLTMNEVYTCVSKIFEDKNQLLEQSKNLLIHLYNKSLHPRIKGGEFYVVYFKDCIVDTETCDAIGLFKSENKDTFLKIFVRGDSIELTSEKGININKLDKGCLIFNTEKEKGYKVSLINNANKGDEAKYWTNDYLGVSTRNDHYHQTKSILSLCKNFVTKELPQEFKITKAEQAILLNKSVDTLKSNTTVDMKRFAEQVFIQPEIQSCFNKYKDIYQKERNIQIQESFNVSTSAIKTKGMGTMTKIKLDNNFDICIHGEKNLIERGFDKESELNYYKLYFKEEK